MVYTLDAIASKLKMTKTNLHRKATKGLLVLKRESGGTYSFDTTDPINAKFLASKGLTL